MLKGFEKQTHPLNDYERGVLLPLLVSGLKTKVGKSNAITNPEICATLSSKGYEMNEPRVRKIINYIRTHHLVPLLIATSKGYWVSSDPKEISEWLETMQGRIDALKSSRDAVLNELKVLTKRGGVKPQGIQTVIPQSLCDCNSPYEYEGLCAECGKPLN